MATNFPASLDSLTNPGSSDPLNSPSHAGQHANANDAIEALEAKVGVDGSADTASLDYKVSQLQSTTVSKTVIDAIGDLIVGSGDNSVTRFGVGNSDELLVADSTQTYRLRWSKNLSGLTLTNPVIGTILNTGTLTLPSSTDTLVGRSTTDTLLNKTITSPVVTDIDLTGGVVDRLQEDWNVVGTAPPASVVIDAKTASSWYYQTATTASFTVTIRGDGSTTLTSLMQNNDSITVALMVNCGATTHVPTSLTIDSTSVTPKWLGGTAPSSVTLGSFMVYTYMILKTATGFTALASASRFG